MLKGTLSPVVVDEGISFTSSRPWDLNKQYSFNKPSLFFVASHPFWTLLTPAPVSSLLPLSLPDGSHGGWCVYPHRLDWHVPAMTQ